MRKPTETDQSSSDSRDSIRARAPAPAPAPLRAPPRPADDSPPTAAAAVAVLVPRLAPGDGNGTKPNTGDSGDAVAPAAPPPRPGVTWAGASGAAKGTCFPDPAPLLLSTPRATPPAGTAAARPVLGPGPAPGVGAAGDAVEGAGLGAELTPPEGCFEVLLAGSGAAAASAAATARAEAGAAARSTALAAPPAARFGAAFTVTFTMRDSTAPWGLLTMHEYLVPVGQARENRGECTQ